MKVLEFIFIDIWHWLGSMSILYLTLHYIVNLLNNIMYHRTLRKIGYPPYSPGESSPIKEEFKKVNEQNSSNR
jgi:hypothetical protein